MTPVHSMTRDGLRLDVEMLAGRVLAASGAHVRRPIAPLAMARRTPGIVAVRLIPGKCIGARAMLRGTDGGFVILLSAELTELEARRAVTEQLVEHDLRGQHILDRARIVTKVADAVLVPRALLEPLLARGMSLVVLSKLFRVSTECMRRRADDMARRDAPVRCLFVAKEVSVREDRPSGVYKTRAASIKEEACALPA